MTLPTDPKPETTGLPVHVAAGAHQLAEQLHQLLHDEVVRAHTDPQAELLWQVAKLINGAVGALNYGAAADPAQRHIVQWVDVAGMASDIADAALRIAAAGMDPGTAAAYQENIDVDALDWPQATAYAATVQVSPADPDGAGRTVTVDVAGSPGRAVTVTGPDEPTPQPWPQSAASLLRTAHHLHRLGVVLGEVIDPAAPATTFDNELED